jgi:hypothetical protein
MGHGSPRLVHPLLPVLHLFAPASDQAAASIFVHLRLLQVEVQGSNICITDGKGRSVTVPYTKENSPDKVSHRKFF